MGVSMANIDSIFYQRHQLGSKGIIKTCVSAFKKILMDALKSKDFDNKFH